MKNTPWPDPASSPFSVWNACSHHCQQADPASTADYDSYSFINNLNQ